MKIATGNALQEEVNAAVGVPTARGGLMEVMGTAEERGRGRAAAAAATTAVGTRSVPMTSHTSSTMTWHASLRRCFCPGQQNQQTKGTMALL